MVVAFLEITLFAWVFGIDKGWEEITRDADIRIPIFFKYVTCYITPVFIGVVLLGSLLSPENGNWINAFSSFSSGQGWPFGYDSVISKIFHLHEIETRWFIDGSITQRFIIDMARFLLLFTFIGLSMLVYKAAQNRKNQT